jgi:hypothetical protein
VWLALLRHRRALCAAAGAALVAAALPVAVVVLVVAGPPPAGVPAAAASISPAAAPSGALVSAGGITVDSSIAEPVRALLLAAESEGVALAGSGHRSAEVQIELRRAHCGTSDYAVFDMPAEACSPPTARPGHSMHERGLAIDFTCAGQLVRRSDRCFGWLATHAGRFGLSNLPSEPWHWSVNGR